jgi:peptidoglycan hydrolase-like protein with peptidoglycan-binding domain
VQDRTQGGLRPSADVEEDAVLSDGFVARLTDHVFENPAMSGGLFVMALTAAAIVSNAMMMQNGHHPDPLFMTRPMPVAHAPVPLPRARVEQPVKPPVPVPLPRQAPAPQPAAALVTPLPDARLIADVQQALAGKRLYRGAADGIAGSRTRAAIAAYEKSAGLPVNGVATADLLARLRSSTKQLAAVKPLSVAGKPPAIAAASPAAPPPVAPAVQPAAAAAAPSPSAAASAEQSPAPVPAARQAIEAIAAPPTPDEAAPAADVAAESAAPVAARQAIDPAAAPQAAEPMAPVAEAAPDAGPAVDAPAGLPDALAAAPVAPASPAEPASVVAAAPVAAAPAQPARAPAIGDRQRYHRVQDALNQAGYGPLTTDGIPNEETASAIRRFELDNGLPITGKPGDRVAARLVSIGAMQAN